MLLYASVQHARKHKNTRCILLPIHNDIDYGLYQDLLDFGTSGEIIVMDFCNPCDIRDLEPTKKWTHGRSFLTSTEQMTLWLCKLCATWKSPKPQDAGLYSKARMENNIRPFRGFQQTKQSVWFLKNARILTIFFYLKLKTQDYGLLSNQERIGIFYIRIL